MNEARIIEQILHGDVEAYGDLVRKYAPSLAAVARHLTTCTEDAEDLAQEALVDAYRHLASLQDRRKFKAWLFVILRNKCRDYLQCHRPDLVSLDDYTDILPAQEPEEASELVDLLNSLPLADREVLAARYLQDLSFEEIAETLGITPEAARMRCSRARTRLRALVEQRVLAEQREEARALRVMGVFLTLPLQPDFVERVMQSARQTPHSTKLTGAAGALKSSGLLKLIGLCGVVTLCVLSPILVKTYSSKQQPSAKDHRQSSPTVALNAPIATQQPPETVSRTPQQRYAPVLAKPVTTTIKRRPSPRTTTTAKPVSTKRKQPAKSPIPTTDLPTAENTPAPPVNTTEQTQSSQRNNNPMEPTIINRKETILVGLAAEGGSIDALWQAYDAYDKQIKHKVPGTYYEVHTYPDDPQSGKAPEYLVGVEVTEAEAIPEGLVARRLPAGPYAVFTHRLANSGYTGCNDAMNAWLKNGPYQLSPNRSIQVFDARFKGSDNPESIIDFLLPVKKKE